MSEATWRAKLKEDLDRDGLPRAEADSLRVELIKTLARKHLGLALWLARHPVDIVLFRRLSNDDWSGWYNHGRGGVGATIALDASRTYVHVFETLLHELGHHLHFCEKERVDHVIQDGFSRVITPSCPITATSPAEFFAESLFAFLERNDELERVDPIGAQVVRDVLAIVGIESSDLILTRLERPPLRARRESLSRSRLASGTHPKARHRQT